VCVRRRSYGTRLSIGERMPPLRARNSLGAAATTRTESSTADLTTLHAAAGARASKKRLTCAAGTGARATCSGGDRSHSQLDAPVKAVNLITRSSSPADRIGSWSALKFNLVGVISGGRASMSLWLSLPPPRHEPRTARGGRHSAAYSCGGL
jgi:hypothetical protein